MKKFVHWVVMAVLLAVVLIGQQLGVLSPDAASPSGAGGAKEKSAVEAASAGALQDNGGLDEKGHYNTKDEVAMYIAAYKKLPGNFITKAQAEKLGFDNRAHTLDKVAPGKSIGGDHFGNYESQLPAADGRKYRECDIDYRSGVRGVKRIVFSSDGLIYYTGDHYKTFERLY